MKKIIYLSLFLSLFVFTQATIGQGLENFNNYVGSSGTYSSGTFLGQDGSTWSYTQCRSDRAIVAPSPCLGKARNPTANVVSGLIAGGCGTLSFDYKQGFSSAVNLDVFVNGLKVGNVTSPGGNGDTANVHNSGPIAVNVAGSFTLKFKQADSTASGQATIDNVTWTGNGTILPEPTNYPTSFIATPSNFKITLSWADATGATPPTAYLVKASSADNITAPVDGTPVSDDPNLSDGSATLNILQGAQTCYFSGLLSNTPYYFKIYSYTNSGTLINFKTDGTVPSVSATTPNTAIIHQQNFNTYSLTPWTTQDILGAQFWTIDSIHGTSGSACAKMNGYSGGAIVNEDWLISPALNFTLFNDEQLSFENAFNYSGDPLIVRISSNYNGTGDPNDYNWTDLTANLSTGGYAWAASGDIDISNVNGTAVYIAFTYTSTATAASTWEVDDVLVMGTPIVGINEKAPVSFSYYPNPAKDNVNITFSSKGDKQIRIIDLLGAKVKETSAAGSSVNVDLSGLNAGVYFIQVTIDGNTMTRKLIVR